MQTFFFSSLLVITVNELCTICLSVNRFACISHQTQNIYTTLICGPLLFVCLPFVRSFCCSCREHFISHTITSTVRCSIVFGLCILFGHVDECAFVHVAVTASFVLCVDFIFAVCSIDI